MYFVDELPKDFLAAMANAGKPAQPSERIVEKVVHVERGGPEIQQKLDEERTRLEQVYTFALTFGKNRMTDKFKNSLALVNIVVQNDPTRIHLLLSERIFTAQ